MAHAALEAALGKADVATLRDRLRQLGATTRQNPGAVANAIAAGWEEAAKVAMQDKVLSHEEEKALMTYASALSLQQLDLDTKTAGTRESA
jgi:hypothetical protein